MKVYSTPIYFRTIDPPKNRPKISFLSFFVLKYLHCLCGEIVLLFIVLKFNYSQKYEEIMGYNSLNDFIEQNLNEK